MILDDPVRRVRHALQSALQILKSAGESMQIFMRGWRGGAAVRSRRLDGLLMIVRADEEVGREIYFYGEYETHEAEYVLSHIRETDVCLDLGANIGYYTLALARRAYMGSVHSFEPVPLNFHILSTNVLLNGLKNVSVNQVAIGKTNTIATFSITDDAAFSSLLHSGRKALNQTIDVRVTTIDAYCDSHSIDRIDFLKADVEGAECEILQGARKILSDPLRRPRFMMLELFEPMLRSYGSSIDDIVHSLAGYGYSPFVCGLDRIMPFSREHHDVYYNVLFLNSDSSGALEGVPSALRMGEAIR